MKNVVNIAGIRSVGPCCCHYVSDRFRIVHQLQKSVKDLPALLVSAALRWRGAARVAQGSAWELRSHGGAAQVMHRATPVSSPER